jgi:hypothetical protein
MPFALCAVPAACCKLPAKSHGVTVNPFVPRSKLVLVPWGVTTWTTREPVAALPLMVRLKLTLVPSPAGTMLLAVRDVSTLPFRRKRTALAPWRFAPESVTPRPVAPIAPELGATEAITGPPVTARGPLAAGVLWGVTATLTGPLAAGLEDGVTATLTGPLAAGVEDGVTATLTGALAVGLVCGVTWTLTGAAASNPLTWPTTRTDAVASWVGSVVRTASMGTGCTGGGVLGAV